MVIVAIPSFKPGTIKSDFNPRFGRSEYFTFINIDKGEIKEVRAVKNQGINAFGGAGVQAAQLIGNNGASEVIAKFLGPNAYQSLISLNIKIYQAPDKQVTVNDCITAYLEHKLPELNGSNVNSHFGMGGAGRGRGRGR